MSNKELVKISARKFEAEFDYWLEQVDKHEMLIYVYDHVTDQTVVMLPVSDYEKLVARLIKFCKRWLLYFLLYMFLALMILQGIGIVAILLW